MKVTISRETEKRKVVAFYRFGDLIMRNEKDERNTVLGFTGKCSTGHMKFEELLRSVVEKEKIYEGDSITIQF